VQPLARRGVAIFYLLAAFAALLLAASSARAATAPADMRAGAPAATERSTGFAHAGLRGRTFRGHPAGTVYRAQARVRAATRGRVVCLSVREVFRGRVIVRGTRCVRTNGRWQHLRTTRFGKRSDASTLRVVARSRSRSTHFRVRGIRIVPVRRPAPPLPQLPTTPPAPQPPTAPAGRPAFGTQFHCLWDHYSNAERIAVLDKLQAAGVQWVRIDVGWYGIEDRGKGSRNAWYTGNVDFCVNEAVKRGIKVLATLWLTPEWANGGRSPQVAPTNPQDYADFAGWAASYWKGRVSAWEVWNEPDPSQSFWQGTTAQYVDLLKAAYPALKAGDPNATVVLGGPSFNDHRWIREVYEAGAKGSFDVLSTHPYQGVADAAPETATDGNRWWFTSLPAVRQVMLEYGDDKPVWFTEMGWSAHANWSGVENWQRGVTDTQQGDYLVRSIEYTKANYPYVPVMFWYKELKDPEGTNVHLEGYSLLNADLSERPVYSRLKSYLTGA
jgi:hypothetical protein